MSNESYSKVSYFLPMRRKLGLTPDQGVAMYVWFGIDCTVIFEKSDVATSR